MSLKLNVKLSDLQPQMMLALIIIAEEFKNIEQSWMITSANDSKHGENSLHYKGRALDFRTKHLFKQQWPSSPTDAMKDERERILMDFVEGIRIRLGVNYDVILESIHTDNEHLHVEYDPHTGVNTTNA